MADEKNKENLEIFEEAFNQSLPQPEPNHESGAVEEKSQMELALEKTENPDTAWSRMEKAMTGKFADKFINAMEALPDKEFIRTYLKAIEYFKPKVTRTEPIGNNDNDNVIQVVLTQRTPEGEIIELTIGEDGETYQNKENE